MGKHGPTFAHVGHCLPTRSSLKRKYVCFAYLTAACLEAEHFCFLDMFSQQLSEISTSFIFTSWKVKVTILGIFSAAYDRKKCIYAYFIFP